MNYLGRQGLGRFEVAGSGSQPAVCYPPGTTTIFWTFSQIVFRYFIRSFHRSSYEPPFVQCLSLCFISFRTGTNPPKKGPEGKGHCFPTHREIRNASPDALPHGAKPMPCFSQYCLNASTKAAVNVVFVGKKLSPLLLAMVTDALSESPGNKWPGAAKCPY